MAGTLRPITMERFTTSITSTRKRRGLIPETGLLSVLFIEAVASNGVSEVKIEIRSHVNGRDKLEHSMPGEMTPPSMRLNIISVRKREL